MERWLLMRFLEDRTCKDHSRCLTTTAIAGRYFVPCYHCNGGKRMSQNFHCQKCKTVWLEETNNWVLTKLVKCPFCGEYNKVYVTMKNGKLIGDTSLDSSNTEIK